MRFAALLLLALTFASSPALAQAPAAEAQSKFDQAIAAAKSKMMADPAAAYDLAVEAGKIAEADDAAGAGQAAETATALWLQGEALNRLNRAGEAVPLLESGSRDCPRTGE